MAALVKVESGGNPYALNINGGEKLLRQPRSAAEARAWANWLVSRGYSVDMGLAQINSGNLNKLGVSPAQLFDPCTNLGAGAKILTANYIGAANRYGNGQTALRAALSAYNTGNHRSGIANGYVAKVTAAAEPTIAPPLRKSAYQKPSAPIIASAETAGSTRSPLVMWVKR
jgi:type IV secretion system protein VirB1